MGLIDELDRLNTNPNDTSTRSIAGPSRITENRNENSRSISQEKSKVQVVSDHSEDEGDIDPAQFAGMSLEELRKEVSKYGFRPSKSRKVMIEQLKNVYQAIRDAKTRKEVEVGETSSLFSSSPPSSMLILPPETPTISRDAPGMSEKVGSQPVERLAYSSEEDAEVTEGSNSAQSEDESDDEPLANRSLRDVVRSSTANVAFGSVPAEVSQQLHDAIISDEDLYRRILLFEPISFDEVNSLAKKAGIQGLRSKETLRNWLDVQCICFYSTELTGQRQRY